MSKILLIAIFLFLSSCGLFEKRKKPVKKVSPPVTSQKFLFENRIIHPECVMKLQDFPLTRRTEKNLKILFGSVPKSPKKSSVDLAKCEFLKSSLFIENNAVTFERPKGEGMAQYEVIANTAKDEFLLKYLWNGGGSGYFSGVQLVSLKGPTLRLIKQFPLGGDRCNGGTSIHKSKEGKTELKRNLTPIDFLELSSAGRALKLEAYEDLESSAASCYAQQIYELLTGDKKQGVRFNLLGTQTLDIGETNTDLKTRYSLQGCFDVQFNKLRSSKKSKLLTAKDLEDFALSFKKACID